MSLSAIGVSKSFGDSKALEDVSLRMEQGSIHGLVGENGAGKSTLLQIMAGIYKPDDGRVEFYGIPVYENPKAKGRIAFVPTQCGLFADYHEKELLRFYAGVYERFDAAKYHRITRKIKFSNKAVRKLSTGMQMIVSVALALATTPEMVLLDEPFAGLDVVARKLLIDTLIEESEVRDVAVLISSHNVNELERLCDAATFLSRGKVIQSGSLMSVKKHAARKLQVVFHGEAPENLKLWEGIISVDALGKVYYLTVDGMDDTIDARLEAAGILMMEELDITLEEAFIYSYEQGGKAQ